MSPLYINIHSHHSTDNDSITVKNHIIHSAEGFNINLHSHSTCGIHPWYIENDIDKQLDLLYTIATHKNIIGIGECGVDLVKSSASIEQQKKVFIAHIKLANKLQKPLTVHCTRAYDQIIQLLKKEKNNVPVIFHGFHGNQTIASTVLKKGYYLSFGAALLTSHQLQAILMNCDNHQYFLETDDSKSITINTLYQKVAELKKSDMNTIIKQQYQNYIECYVR